MTDKPEQRNSEETRPPGGRTFTFKRMFTFGRPPPPETHRVKLVPGDTRTFKWEWRGPDCNDAPKPKPDDLLSPDTKPATYYEALSGRRDPMRNFFITA